MPDQGELKELFRRRGGMSLATNVPIIRGGIPNDLERAQDVLTEFSSILASAGFMLKHETHGTLLCRLTSKDQAVAVCYVDAIVPGVGIQVRKCNS